MYRKRGVRFSVASFTQKTIKMVWGRAAGMCSMPDCRVRLVLDETETDNPALVGEIAHIVGEKETAARGASAMTLEQRNLYGNLLLLCGHHHNIVDEHEGKWSVDALLKIKSDHESWVETTLSSSSKAELKKEELYAQYVDEWCEILDIDNWTAWSSFAVSNGQPVLGDEYIVKLKSVPKWTMSRIWPGTLPELEFAFINFARVANDFVEVFLRHATKSMTHG